MNTKKVFTVVLVALFALATVFAGGSSDNSTASTDAMPSEIDVWIISNPNEDIGAAYDQAGLDFEAETGIKVNYIRTPTNDFHTRLVTSISANIYPDVIIWNSTPGIEFSETGKVLPMNEIIDEVGRDQFGESVLKMFTIGDNIYEAPIFVRPGGLHARRSWLEAAGYDLTLKTDENGYYYIEGLETYEDLIEAGKKITNVAEGKYGLGFGFSRKAFGDSASFCFTAIASYGGRILGEDGKLDVDTPETRAAIQMLIDFWNSGAVPAAATTWDGNSNNQFFISGDIGVVMNSNSIMAKLNDTTGCPPDDLVILPPLKGPGGEGYMSASPETITVFKTSKVEGAKAFARYMLRTDVQVKMFERMGFGYYSPLKKETMADPLFANLTDNEKVFMNGGSLSIGPSFPSEPNAKLTALYSAFFYDDILSRIAVDGWNVDQIVKEMVQKANETLFD